MPRISYFSTTTSTIRDRRYSLQGEEGFEALEECCDLDWSPTKSART